MSLLLSTLTGHDWAECFRAALRDGGPPRNHSEGGRARVVGANDARAPFAVFAFGTLKKNAHSAIRFADQAADVTRMAAWIQSEVWIGAAPA